MRIRVLPLLITATMVAVSTAVSADCIAPTDRSTTASQVLTQYDACIKGVYKTGLQARAEDLMDIARHSLLLKDHVRLAYRTGLDKPIAQLSRVEGTLYAQLAELADEVVATKENSQTNFEVLHSKIQTLIDGLPLRGFDPQLANYGPIIVDKKPNSDSVDVFVDRTKLGNVELKLKDASGVAYAVSRVRGNDAIFSLPASLFDNRTEMLQSTMLALVVPARRAEHDYTLLYGIPVPELGTYSITYTTETTDISRRKQTFELDRLESTLMLVQEETRKVCALDGWQIDHNEGHDVTVLNSRHGEVVSVNAAGDSCVEVALIAKPYGRAFGNERAKKGFIEATLSFTAYQRQRASSNAKRLEGKLAWGMDETFRVDAPLATIKISLNYFDNSTSELDFNNAKDERVLLNATRGETKFNLKAMPSPGQ